MSQMYTTTLGEFNKDLFVLDMPFLFRSHEHAAQVLEGQIGQSLMAGLAKSSNIQGLAFTYSGGYRMIAATKALKTVDDFKDVRIRIADRSLCRCALFCSARGRQPQRARGVLRRGVRANRCGAIQPTRDIDRRSTMRGLPVTDHGGGGGPDRIGTPPGTRRVRALFCYERLLAGVLPAQRLP